MFHYHNGMESRHEETCLHVPRKTFLELATIYAANNKGADQTMRKPKHMASTSKDFSCRASLVCLHYTKSKLNLWAVGSGDGAG